MFDRAGYWSSAVEPVIDRDIVDRVGRTKGLTTGLCRRRAGQKEGRGSQKRKTEATDRKGRNQRRTMIKKEKKKNRQQQREEATRREDDEEDKEENKINR